MTRTQLLEDEVVIEDILEVEDEDEDDDDDAAPAPATAANLLHGMHAAWAPPPSTASPLSLWPTSGPSPRPSKSLSPTLPPSIPEAARWGAPRLVTG